MRIAVLMPQVPFVRGGAEVLCEALCGELERRGHETELVEIPFGWFPADVLLDQLLAARMTRIANADRVIATKFPAYCVDHPHVTTWLLHQHRLLYDLWGAPGTGTDDSVRGRALRDIFRRADRERLASARRYVISGVVRDRLQRYCGLDSQVLNPPLIDPQRFRHGPSGDYVFFPGRIGLFKRQALVIEAMARVRSDVRLVIGGPPAREEELWPLRALIARHRLGGRVELLGEWLPAERQAELYAGALAVVVPPVDEDYGLVTLEAFASAKPVVTCTDSGGPAQLVEDGSCGFVTAPQPAALAAAFDRLRGEAGLAQRMGEAAVVRLGGLALSWDDVVDALVA
jgi:glycosyltransferase involved in cell wall biosynthesis